VTATVPMPSPRHVRKTRSAISPRFATSSRRIGTAALYAGGAIGSGRDPIHRAYGDRPYGNAVGLIVASLVFDDFSINITGFILSLIVFTVAVALLTPFLTNAMMRGRSNSAALGGVALISTFAALVITDLFSDGLDISGVETWIGATVVVWLASLLAVFILPFLGLKKYLDDRRA